MVRNIVLDMGMVLMDYHPLAACRAVAPDDAAAERLCAALFFDPDWAKLDEGAISMEALRQNTQARLAGTGLEPLVPALIDGIPENIISPLPGMAAVTAWLLASDYHLYLLSNACLAVSHKRELVPYLERFHGVVFSADEKLVKPNPAIYRLLTERYGLWPEECLFIDDNEGNVQAARKLGWQVYRFDGDIPALCAMLVELHNRQAVTGGMNNPQSSAGTGARHRT
jgi:putative hydrolase of the HAD superfamily